MDRAVAVIRQSQGDDDSVSLELQRERVVERAERWANEVDVLDLGTHTGFSVHMAPEKAERIDTNPKVLKLIRDLRRGRYDVLVAWDDTRVARDQFYWQFEYAANLGGCEFRYVENPPEDRLTFRVLRAVGSESKYAEIKKARQAVERRIERGDYQGRPPKGLQFDADGRQLVTDPDEWPEVRKVLRLREAGHSYNQIADQTELTKNQVGNIVRKSDRYAPFYPGAEGL